MTSTQLFLRGCRKRLFRLKVADSTGVRLTGGLLLSAALVMRRLLNRASVVTTQQQMIGVLLPPSVGAVLANVAIALSGKVAVNLNYSFSNDSLDRCIDECGIAHVLTSRHFLKRRPFSLKAELVYLEDLQQEASWFDKLVCVMQSFLLPSFVLERVLCLKNVAFDDLMAVLFTSGTTGDPKGVMLSHQNIAFSIDAIDKLFRVDREDVFLGILPFFHAFGYSATLWMALSMDMAVVYHFDPFGAKTLGKLARKFRVTVLFATPTFLNIYLHRCRADEFASLDLAVVGAEKLDASLANAFHEKFGATPVEGYGTTELSPWAAVNVPAHRSLSKDHVGIKSDTVGQPVPGVQVKIVDPDSHAELKVGEAGLLMVSGPNVMLGYLNNPEKTADVIVNGWYNTGDFARLDADGFIQITGRQSRFSKIGGETVPHEKLEKLITKIVSGADEQPDEPIVAVTAIPDTKRGERLIVLHSSLGGKTASEIIKELAAADVPRIWIPRPDDFISVEQIPLTSLGKLNLGSLRRTAEQAKIES